MYITINDIKGEETIDLSYPIWNFGFTAGRGKASKEIAVISMLSENTQYEMTKPLKLKLADGSVKEVLNKTYMSRESNAFVEGKHIISDLDNNPQINKTNNWMNSIIAITSKMENPATTYLLIIFLVLKILRISNQ